MKNKKNNHIIIPLVSYSNTHLQKKEICKNNKYKTGIYILTHIISGKSYVGSAIDLCRRLRNFFNTSYLEREVKNNNSLIYKVLLKYGCSSFKIDIIEYCDATFLINKKKRLEKSRFELEIIMCKITVLPN